MMPTVTVTQGAGYRLTEIDAIKPFLAALPDLKRNLAFGMGKGLETAVRGAYESDGYGSWRPKSPDATARAGSGKLMRGLSGTLMDSLSTRFDLTIRPGMDRRSEFVAVGWWPEPHPDHGALGLERQTAPLNMAELAVTQELGVRADGAAVGSIGEQQWSIGGGGGSLWTIPPRPLLTLAADKEGEDIMDRELLKFALLIGKYRFPIPRARGGVSSMATKARIFDATTFADV